MECKQQVFLFSISSFLAGNPPPPKKKMFSTTQAFAPLIVEKEGCKELYS